METQDAVPISDPAIIGGSTAGSSGIASAGQDELGRFAPGNTMGPPKGKRRVNKRLEDLPETVDEPGDAETQLDDMRWAYKSRDDAKPKTPGQEKCQRMLKDDFKGFMALKTQLEMRAAQLSEASLLAEGKKREGEVDEKTEELLEWARAWLEERRVKK